MTKGVLTDLPTGNSADDTARRAEMQGRIREITALCHENNPNAEIFITSNFGGAPTYLVTGWMYDCLSQ